MIGGMFTGCSWWPLRRRTSPVTHDAPLDLPNPKCPIYSAFAPVLAPLALAVGLAFNRAMASARPKKVMKSWLLIPGIAAASLRVRDSSPTPRRDAGISITRDLVSATVNLGQ
jgi:hypothetical protein